jgi:hypothetical protein
MAVATAVVAAVATAVAAVVVVTATEMVTAVTATERVTVVTATERVLLVSEAVSASLSPTMEAWPSRFPRRERRWRVATQWCRSRCRQ